MGGTNFGINSNSNDEFDGVNARLYGSSFGNINTLYSYIYIKSDTFGTLNWGHLSPASDNPAVLADASGTVIELNFVFFEGGGFATKAKGASGPGASWNSFVLCSSAVAPGADCFGAAEPAVRYDSPTWGGFRFETSYGTADVVPAILDADAGNTNTDAFFIHPSTDDSHFWDLAVFYVADWNSIKISLAAAYTWMESNPLNGGEEDYWQVGGTIMHKPSGLGIYAIGSLGRRRQRQQQLLGIWVALSIGVMPQHAPVVVSALPDTDSGVSSPSGGRPGARSAPRCCTANLPSITTCTAWGISATSPVSSPIAIRTASAPSPVRKPSVGA